MTFFPVATISGGITKTNEIIIQTRDLLISIREKAPVFLCSMK